jgi:PDZ domain
MKYARIACPGALVAALVLQAGQAGAQATERTAIEERTATAEAEDRFDEQMKLAEERLAAAAREVAELSAKRLDKYGDGRNFVYEYSDKPRLGVNISDDDSDSPVEGVKVISVTPGSAADEAGIRAGDVLTAVNGEMLSADSRKVANKRLLAFMEGVKEGDVLEVDYLRNGKVTSVDVSPRQVENNVFVWTPDSGNFSMPRAPEVHSAPVVIDRFRRSFGGWRGGLGDMEVVELSEGLGRYFGTDEGLLVISAPKTNDFQLQEGDVIQSIDGRRPESVDHCMRILGSYQPGETLALQIMRDKKSQTLRVSVPDARTSFSAEPAALPAPDPAERPLPSPAAAPAPDGRT